jgi:hypothetical protein
MCSLYGVGIIPIPVPDYILHAAFHAISHL